MKDSLSIQEAQKLILLSQKLPPAKQSGNATSTTLSAIENLGYVQIDTISVIQRAHHHTLWNRNPRYEANQLDQLLADKTVFEYWSHAAAYLPFRDYRFTLPRKYAFASGEQAHWFDRDKQLMKTVRQRITKEGPLMAKDFEHTGKKIGEWKTKPAKRALECLFMEGKLMIPYRVNFHKVYDLTERVFPHAMNTTPPEPMEYARFLITRYLKANGLGQTSEIAYLMKDTKPMVTATLHDMVANDELLKVSVADKFYYAIPASLELLNKSIASRKLKILSPFDNLVIQRQRMKALFGFDYMIECYVPAVKRRYGYFVLPILWDGKLVARMDCKADRKEAVMHMHHFTLEPGISNTDSLFLALRKELEAFLRFNQCKHLQVHRTSPAKIKPALQIVLNDLRG